MKPRTPVTNLHTSAEVGQRWNYHPSHVPRVMRRFGVSGLKFGSTKQSARRFADEDVRRVERLAGLKIPSDGDSNKTAR
ncbi:MAG: hypothetical protein WCO94_02815 [Verrucomicrobiota bacterium]